MPTASRKTNNQEPKCGHIREFFMTLKTDTEISDDNESISTDGNGTNDSK